MSFTTRNLTGERVLVKGTDIEGGVGEEVLDASQWNELKARSDLQTAGAEFDEAVEKFYAPLLAAAEKVGKTLERPEDSLAFVVLDEGSEAVPGRPKHTVKLTRDSMILRLVEDGHTDRLVWVGEQLEILEVLPTTDTTPAPATAVEQGSAFSPEDDASFDRIVTDADNQAGEQS